MPAPHEILASICAGGAAALLFQVFRRPRVVPFAEVCDVCRYRLRGLPHADEGVVCPECGALQSRATAVAGRRQRWKRLVCAVLLLLLIEPAWRSGECIRAKQFRALTIAPTWMVALLWPVPAPGTSSEVWQEFVWRSFAPDDPLSHPLVAEIVAWRYQFVWDGETLPLRGVPRTLSVGVAPNRWSQERALRRGWSDVERERAQEGVSYAWAHSSDAPAGMKTWGVLHAEWRRDVLGVLTGAPVSSWVFQQDELDIDWPLLSYSRLDPVQWRGQIMFITVQNLDARKLARAWRSLVSFYNSAGPTRKRAVLQEFAGDTVVAYWVGDVCESGAVTRASGRLRPQQLRADFEYSSRAPITAWFACAVDPTGEIAVVRTDAATHKEFADYLARLRSEVKP